MRIDRTRIRNLENYIAVVPPGSSYRIVFEVGENDVLARLGLATDAGNGETILPAIVGPTTRYNAEGRWIARRDLPKERRYIRTVRWTWTTWGGDEHEDYRDIYRDCYQREFVPPPAVELTYVEHGGQRLIVSPMLQHVPDKQDLALHTINLFLELFRSCEIATADLQRLAPPALKRANWKLLPTGKYPWEMIEEHVIRATGRMSDAARSVILDRQKTLESLKPDERWVGEGGFNDYMAYVFSDYGIVVLESLRRDNAIYVFTGDWRPVSRLTKAEIVQDGLHHARIIHSQGWKERLGSLFTKRAA